MGAGQSTRDIPDYVYVNMNINEEGYITVKLSVYDTNLRYQVRQYMRDKDDMEINKDPLPPPLSTPKDPREEKEVYFNLHADFLEKTKVSFHVTKTLEELIEERNKMFKHE